MDQAAHSTSDGNVPPNGTYRVVKEGGPPLSFDPSVYECPDELIQSIRMKIKEDLGIDVTQPQQNLSSNRKWLDLSIRENLKYHEERFKKQYTYGSTAYGSTSPYTGMTETRHCLTSLSNHAFSWTEKSSGIMWVGVYGIDTICVVTRSGHLDWNRVHGSLASTDSKTVLSLFRKCVLSELEDLADPSSERCKKGLHRSFDAPFCVVSATPGSTGTPDKSGYEFGYATEAIDWVQYSGLLPLVQSSDEPILLAISAFRRLIQKKCEAKEIEVTVLSGRRHGIPSIKDLDISEIRDKLATIERTGFCLCSLEGTSKHLRGNGLERSSASSACSQYFIAASLNYLPSYVVFF